MECRYTGRVDTGAATGVTPSGSGDWITDKTSAITSARRGQISRVTAARNPAQASAAIAARMRRRRRRLAMTAERSGRPYQPDFTPTASATGVPLQCGGEIL